MVAGADLAFVRDHCTLVVLEAMHCELFSSMGEGDTFEVYRLVKDYVWKAGAKPLRPNETLKEIFALARRHKCDKICSDVHYQALVIEALPPDLELLPFPSNAEKITATYQGIKYALGDGRIDLSAASPLLMKDLQNIVAKPVAGGHISVSHPRTQEAGHGDSASALASAFYAAGRCRGAGAVGAGGRRFGRPHGAGSAR